MPAQKEDPEILAMKRVMKALQGLSTNQRYRVLSWVEGKNNETARLVPISRTDPLAAGAHDLLNHIRGTGDPA